MSESSYRRTSTSVISERRKSGCIFFRHIFSTRAHLSPSPLDHELSWIEGMIQEAIPPIVELDESLRNGIAVAKLAKVVTLASVSGKIYLVRIPPRIIVGTSWAQIDAFDW